MKAFAQRVFVAAIVIGIIFLIVYSMEWILLVLAAVLIALGFRTAAKWLERRTRLSLRWATALVLIGAGIFILGTVWEFGSRIAAKADQLLATLAVALRSLEQQGKNYPMLERFLSSTSLDLAQPTETILSEAMHIVAALILVLFVGAYFSVDPGTYIRGFLRFFPDSKRRRVEETLNEIGYALKWWLFGQVIAMTAVGAITAIGLVSIGVPMAIPLAVVAGLMTFVPYIGALLSAIPALMIASTLGTHVAVYTAIVFLIAHFTEGYILVPLIQHRFVYLPPALILANQFLMELLVGFTGMALATPALVVAMVVVQRLYFQQTWKRGEKVA